MCKPNSTFAKLKQVQSVKKNYQALKKVLEPIDISSSDEYISTVEDSFQQFEIIPDLSVIKTLFSLNYTDGCTKRSLSCLLLLIK